ncbi:HNH endonuclease signature motif containing protein [Asticcacaulis sp.]|uniref:HNH endonuclease n=1 Tax=Asticcacaulis sp. TaxID=1872648 RepID=UPI00262CF36D|nr:HNH endonuclease signature motif containing protein [Asticcacaulis sp.]
MLGSYEENRPAIPAEIRRRVFVEAGHRCAIPTCRHIEVDIHHIIPWQKCKAHEYENLIALCPNCHRRADSGVIDRKSLKLYKFNLQFVHDKYSQIEMDLLFELYNAASDQCQPWLPYMAIFFKRIIESGFVAIARSLDNEVHVSGIRSDPIYIVITEKGRNFIKEIGTKEM